MVKGVAKLMKTDLAISVSGIAGPGGGSHEKPVGTIWIAFYIKGKVHSRLLQLNDKRDINRSETCKLALEEVLRYTQKILENGEEYE